MLLVNRHYQPKWDIPGGRVERGETPSEACAREVKESDYVLPRLARRLRAAVPGETRTGGPETCARGRA